MAKNSIDPDKRVDIDYAEYDLETQKLQPTVYKEDGNSFGCLTGPDPETGIYGHGDTPEAAITAWRSELENRFKRLHGDEPKD